MEVLAVANADFKQFLGVTGFTKLMIQLSCLLISILNLNSFTTFRAFLLSSMLCCVYSFPAKGKPLKRIVCRGYPIVISFCLMLTCCKLGKCLCRCFLKLHSNIPLFKDIMAINPYRRLVKWRLVGHLQAPLMFSSQVHLHLRPLGCIHSPAKVCLQ